MSKRVDPFGAEPGRVNPLSSNFFMTPLGSRILRYRRLLVVVSQCVLFLCAYLLAFGLRFEFAAPDAPSRVFWISVPVVIAIKAAVYYVFDLYRGWWRYAGMQDLRDILKATTVASVVMAVLVLLFANGRMPLSVVAMDWMATILLVGGLRFSIRAFREGVGIRNLGNFRNVLIVGAREIGVAMCREMRSNLELRMNPVGFIDDFPAKQGFTIHGVPVLGGRKDLPRILERYNVEEILIAQQGMTGRELREFIAEIKTLDVGLKIVPPMKDLLAEKVSIRHLREVDLADLLGRKSVRLDSDVIRDSIEGRTVFITGAGGSIGSELARQVAAFSPRLLILYERNENNLYYIQLELETRFPDLIVLPVIGDIADRAYLDRLFAEHRPSLIYHAAAYKHVPMMEANAFQAISNNVLGTRCVVEAAREAGVEKFVLISTDKAVRPMNIMGMTKRVTELIALGLPSKATRFTVVRFGNVLGSNGSVIQLFRRQIDEGGPVTVTHPDAKRYFMTIPEAVQLVMQAGTMGKGGEIYVLEMGEQIKIVDLALNLIRLSGYEPEKDIEIRFVGLRPGEKLREELYTKEEGIGPTSHEKIRVVHSPVPSEIDLEKDLAELKARLDAMDEPGAVEKLAAICWPGGLDDVSQVLAEDEYATLAEEDSDVATGAGT